MLVNVVRLSAPLEPGWERISSTGVVAPQMPATAAYRSLGPRVSKPSGCRVQGTGCAFRIDLYDSDDFPVQVGGMQSNLTLRLENQSVAIVDMRNGSLLALVDPDWITRKGPRVFHFFSDEVEFVPTMDDSNTAGPPDGIMLRTVDFLPSLCMGANTGADEQTGATCECLPRGCHRSGREGMCQDQRCVDRHFSG